ncbi:MAG: methyltransferase, partial [Dokdonella sp.]
HTLVQRLAYGTPARLAHFLRQSNANVATCVLDLGCGTGLMAQELVRPGRVIDGVDLSPRMLAHAREKGLYRELHAAELVAFLRASSSKWELIIATDVFIYVANLQPVFACVREHLAAGGSFAFSIECSANDGTELLPATGRYRHAPERICSELREAGFVDIARETLVLRFESGRPVAGELLLARCAVV